MVIIVFFVLTAVIEPPAYVTDLFKRHVYVYKGSNSEEVKISYATFVPRSIQSDNKYPLLVWLHGAGQRGRNNTSQLRHLDETVMPRAGEDNFPLFILAPQAPREVEWSGEEPGTGAPVRIGQDRGDMLNVVVELIDQMVAEHPIDENKITLLGLSSGATAALELADRYPDRFAAVLAFGSSPSPRLSAERLSKVRIWAFHSPIDRIAPVEAIEAMVHRVQSRGGAAELSYSCDNPSLDDIAGNHFCFTGPFVEYDLFAWILSQSSVSDSPAPGEIAWASRLRWHYIKPRLINSAPVLGAVVVLSVIWRELRRRRHQVVEPGGSGQLIVTEGP